MPATINLTKTYSWKPTDPRGELISAILVIGEPTANILLKLPSKYVSPDP